MPVTEYLGDIFKAPEGSVLIHACNCQGEWGSGVAAAFAQKFPAACAIYEDHCNIPGTPHTRKWLVGTTLLIPPQEEDIEQSGSYWIACLLTSMHYGKKKDKPDVILENTRKAMLDFKVKMKKVELDGTKLDDKLYTIRINSAAFNVPWARTTKILEHSYLKIRVVNNVNVMSPKDKAKVIEEMKASGFDTTKEMDFSTEAAASDEAQLVKAQDSNTTTVKAKGKRAASAIDETQEDEDEVSANQSDDEGDKKVEKPKTSDAPSKDVSPKKKKVKKDKKDKKKHKSTSRQSTG